MLYVTERATFALVREGVALAEVAPGVDVRRDVLERIDFTPMIGELRTYPKSILRFRAASDRDLPMRCS
ncbi:MAG TPA: hypothetical protein VF814_19895 [Casimicrobiaceae bacterium]